MNSYEHEPEFSNWQHVLSNDNRNYQMFAYCPMLSQKTCGISSDHVADANIQATEEKQVIFRKGMQYKRPSADGRAYDFCHYQITFNEESIPAPRLAQLRE